jgi:hypothetical protein
MSYQSSPLPTTLIHKWENKRNYYAYNTLSLGFSVRCIFSSGNGFHQGHFHRLLYSADQDLQWGGDGRSIRCANGFYKGAFSVDYIVTHKSSPLGWVRQCLIITFVIVLGFPCMRLHLLRYAPYLFFGWISILVYIYIYIYIGFSSNRVRQYFIMW